jgi:hypothetical protein
VVITTETLQPKKPRRRLKNARLLGSAQQIASESSGESGSGDSHSAYSDSSAEEEEKEVVFERVPLRMKGTNSGEQRVQSFKQNRLKAQEKSAMKDFRGEVFYRSYSPTLVANKSATAVKGLFSRSQDQQERQKKLDALKQARHEILNAEKKQPRKLVLRSNLNVNVNVNEKYMDSQFTGDSPEWQAF